MPINYKDYHPKWSLIRRLVLKRANYCCENCSARNGAAVAPQDQLPAQGPFLFNIDDLELKEVITTRDPKTVILTISHQDHDRDNNRFWNLKCLCQKCHLLHDLAQRVFSFKYGKETQYRNGKLF